MMPQADAKSKIVVYFSKARNLIKILWRNLVNLPKRFSSERQLNIEKKNVILFYLPNGECMSGGILSIYFLIDKSQVLFGNAIVIPVVISSLQRIFKTSWFTNPFFIYNLRRIKKRVSSAQNIVIHIPECFFSQFCDLVRIHKLESITQLATINILNQNAEAMPSDQVFEHNKYLCGKLTMTLAFDINMDKIYSFLDQQQMVLSTWFYKDEYGYLDFDLKDGVCIVSPDNHPLKAQVIKHLEQQLGLRCIEIRNMPFDHYRALRSRAKWSVTFGEGYDAYFVGTILVGGIGFGVDNANFRPPYIDADNLPLNVFTSYEQLCEQIVERMKFFEANSTERQALSDTYRSALSAMCSPQIVIDNLQRYYQSIGFNE